MQWLETLRMHLGGKAHTFLLYSNIADDILREEEFSLLHEVLGTEKPFSDAGIIAYFNLASGIRFATADMEFLFIEELVIKPEVEGMPIKPKDYFEAHKCELGYALSWLTKLLHLGWTDTLVQETWKKRKKDIPGGTKNAAAETRTPFAVVIMEFTETLIPPNACCSSCPQDRRNYTQALDWARDAQIRRRNNVIIFQTDSLQSIDQELHDMRSRIQHIPIALPTREEQKAAVAAWRKNVPRRDADIPDDQLVRLLTGMPHVVTGQMLHEVRANNLPLTTAFIFKRKNQLIEDQTGGMLRAFKGRFGFNALGSMPHVVSYLRNIADALKKGDVQNIPRGVMFVGPPGVGKTVAFEALSCEADVPAVTFPDDVEDPFVGVSQKRMKMGLEALIANGPLIFFADEFDKKMANPDNMFHGDAGTGLQLQGMMQNFLSSDEIWGMVFPIIATNRPGRINPSMIRSGRFDDKIAFLLPKPNDWPDIIRALIVQKQSYLEMRLERSFSVDVSPEDLAEIGRMVYFYIDSDKGLVPGPLPENTSEADIVTLSGADVGSIIQRSFMRAGNKTLIGEHIKAEIRESLPSHDMIDFKSMNEEALLYANKVSFVPEGYRDEWRRLKARRGTGQSSSVSMYPQLT